MTLFKKSLKRVALPYLTIIIEMKGSNISLPAAPLFVQVLLSAHNSALAKAFPSIGFRLKA